jgi:hypothetical protein
MYFGELEILSQTSVSCRVTVTGNKPAILLGFKKESLEYFFDSKALADWK